MSSQIPKSKSMFDLALYVQGEAFCINERESEWITNKERALSF
mgnify:CR=1